MSTPTEQPIKKMEQSLRQQAAGRRRELRAMGERAMSRRELDQLHGGRREMDFLLLALQAGG